MRYMEQSGWVRHATLNSYPIYPQALAVVFSKENSGEKNNRQQQQY